LRKLGLRSAVQRLAKRSRVQKRIAQHQRAFDWAEAIREYDNALYSYVVEESLQFQDVLDLYPLHKRVLGLVEYIIIPRLISRGVLGKGASSLWTNAFTDKTTKLAQAALPTNADKLATLESEGNWVLHSHSHATSNPIDLATLLDGIVARMSSAGEVAGVSVNLQPPTPQVHARQLGALADSSSPEAACMTLYLGKVALMLRNAIEHGTDRVQGNGLLVDTTNYWEDRAGKSVLDWLRDTATQTQVSWRSGPLLPATLPGAANAFVLTPTSLHRCLVLLSLVINAGLSHL
jgi:hypothetical protein